MWENHGFFWKTMGFFFKAMFFYTTSHMIYFDYKGYVFFIKIKTIHVLHKISFQNTIPYRSHSLILIGYVFFFLVVENHCFFSTRILKLCVFYQKSAWRTQNADQKLSLITTNMSWKSHFSIISDYYFAT